MPTPTKTLTAALTAAALCLSAAARDAPAPYRVSGPHTHDNLSVFFLHGDDPMEGRAYLTLGEALAGRKVVVHETKDVNKIVIENVSSDEVFVQAGDLLKGGKQDRTLAVDLVVPAKSGKVAIASLCVEQGRWSQRDMEDVLMFGSSNNYLIGNRLKLAVRSRSPGQVWRGVTYEQSRLTNTLKSDVKDAKSETSLQLTLENGKLLAAVGAYAKKLGKSLDGSKDAIGYAVAINGRVTSADVYANAELFRKLWPRLLESSAAEALAEKDAKASFVAPRPADVLTFLSAEPLRGKDTRRELSGDWREVQSETKTTRVFETGNGKAVLRRSYLAK